MRRTALLAAVVLGLAPGMLLPFAVALRLPLDESDTFVLALSFSLVMINVAVSAVEAHSIANAGRRIGAGDVLGLRDLATYSLGSMVKVSPVIVVGMALLYLLYAAGTSSPLSLATTAGLLVSVPLVGSVSAAFAGAMIARGRPLLPILTQGLRSIVPLAGMATPWDLSPTLLAGLYALGEVMRLLVLVVASVSRRSERRAQGARSAEGVTRGLYWQIVSNGTSQLNPVVDRAFLNNGQAGDITAYELADKVSFALYQFTYNVMLLSRIGRWSSTFGRAPRRAYELFVRDVGRMFLVTLALAASGAAAILLAFAVGVVPADWSRGVAWGAIVLFAMPFSIVMISCMRFIVIQDATKFLLPATLCGFTVNLVCDLLLFHAIGGVGIPIASVATKVVSAILFLGVIRHVASRTKV